MAVLHPSTRPVVSDGVSQAELDVLDALASGPADWHVLHSLWLKSHHFKRDAEVDFVVVTEMGVLCLEAKGGDVWRDDAGWHFRPKHGGKEDVRPHGPVDQVRGGMYAIRDQLRKIGHGTLFDNFVWGYGVVLPNCVLKVTSRDFGIDPDIVLDERAFPASLETFLRALAAYWLKRISSDNPHGRIAAGRIETTLSAQRRIEFVRLLRPNFDLIIGVGAKAASSEAQIVRLTEAQKTALDFAALEPRNLLIGSAGTGKSVLAIAQAERMAGEGKRVLFVCFNRLFGDAVRDRLSKVPGGSIAASNFHLLAVQLVAAHGMSIPVSETWEAFSAQLGDLVVRLCDGIRESERFDYLVVDEAQDLMHEDFLELLGLLLRGGLEQGSWLIALDQQQAIFRDNFDQRQLDRLSALGRRSLLEVNCRNTRPIAAHVRGLTGVGSVSTRSSEGEIPQIRYYGDFSAYLRELRKTVNELIGAFVESARSPSEITILTADWRFIPDEVRRPGFFIRPLAPVSISSGDSGSVRYSTIQAFKGLESTAIVVVGIEALNRAELRELFYVGASRARSVLRMLLPETCTDYADRLADIFRFMKD
jgi:hypothetical protein